MERFFKSSFGFKFWRNKPEKQEKINQKIVYDNLIATSDCLASRHKNPRFAGNRGIATHNVVTGKY